MSREKYEHLAALCEDGCVRTSLCRALESATKAIQAIALIDGEEDYKNTGGKTARLIADDWLAVNGCEDGRTIRERAQREKRAEQLDAEIERLRAERAKL